MTPPPSGGGRRPFSAHFPPRVESANGCNQVVLAAHIAAKRPTLLAWLVRHLPLDLDEAESLVQDAVLQAWLHRAEFTSRDHLRRWLFRVAHNCAVSHLRRRDRLQTGLQLDEGEHFLDQGAATGDGAQEQAELQELQSLVREAIETLPRPQREVVLLHYIHSLPLGEVAQILNLGLGAVKMRLWRARTTLRRQLEHLST